MGLVKSRLMEIVQDVTSRKLDKAISHVAEMNRNISVEEILELCNPYVHKHYDGDPPIALGAAAGLARTGISGVANILPFTCLPGTFITSVARVFRKDYENIPWVDIAYDGQEDTGIETRLQAFMYQAKEFARERGHDKPRNWTAGV